MIINVSCTIDSNQEPNAKKIDWTNPITVYDKVDGSLATLYWYGNEWNVSSSSLADASGPLPCKMTFAELFWDIWNKLGYNLPTDKTMCYMFEMLSPRNTIIVRPDREAMILHGVRKLIKPYPELEPEPIAKKQGWECIKTFSYKNDEELLTAAKQLNPMQAGQKQVSPKSIYFKN